MPQDQANKEKDVLVYFHELKELKSVHSSIQIAISRYIRVIEEQRGPKREAMQSVVSRKSEIKKELYDDNFGEIYPDSSLNKVFSLYEEAQRDFNTKQEREIFNLIEFIKELVDTSNNIKEKIITKTIVQKEEPKSEQEIKAFENKQKEDMIFLQKKIPNKLDFNIIRDSIIKRAETEEEKIITNNLSLDLFGKKLEDVKWKIGGGRKTTN